LAGIRAAGEAGDWRALEAFMRMSFQKDYRQSNQTNVAVNVPVQTALVCTEEQRQRLIALREKVLASGAK